MEDVDLYRGQQFVCLVLHIIFVTDVVVPHEVCKTENALLFKIVPKFISKHKPLML